MNAPNSANVYDPGLEASGERADLLATSADNTEGTQIIAISVSYTHLTLPTILRV